MISTGERIGSEDELFRRIKEAWANSLRVAAPGIIESFDSQTQTATIKIAIRERIIIDGKIEEVEIPSLLDVPICLPRAGGFTLTMPIKKGDECLVIFADMCIDAWFSNGNIQNQIERRRHDLSDAFAIIGAWSQPKALTNYSTNSAQLRNDAGTTYIDLKDGEINLVASVVKRNGVPI